LSFIFFLTDWLEVVHAARWSHQGARRAESGELVDGVQRFRHPRVTCDPGVIRVAEDGLQDVVRIPQRPQYADALRRVLGRGRVRLVRKALVVEVVHQPRQSPPLDFLVEVRGVRAHRALDREHVLPE
jgi:hypothetical protein